MLKILIIIIFIALAYFFSRLYIIFNNISLGKYNLSNYQSDYCEKIMYDNMIQNNSIFSIQNITLNDLKHKHEEYFQASVENRLNTTSVNALENEFFTMLDIYSCFNKEFKKDKFILLYVDGYSIDQFDFILNSRFNDSLILKQKMIDFKQSGSVAETLMTGKFSQNYPAKTTNTDNIIYQLIMFNRFLKNMISKNNLGNDDVCVDNKNAFECFMSKVNHNINDKSSLRNAKIKDNFKNENDTKSKNRLLDSLISKNTKLKTDSYFNIKNKNLYFTGTHFPLYSLMGSASKEFNEIDLHQKKESFLFEYICNYLEDNKNHITLQDIQTKYKLNPLDHSEQIKNEVYGNFSQNSYSQYFFHNECMEKFKNYDNIIFYTTLLDSLNHALSKFHAETIYHTTVSQVFIKDVMNWIDENPQYALYIVSDHGGQSFLTEDNFCNHGCSKNNEGFLMTYFGSNDKTKDFKINDLITLPYQKYSRKKLDMESVTKMSSSEKIEKLPKVEINDISNVISYFTNGLNNPLESSGLFPTKLINDEFLELSILRHKEMQIKDYSYKLMHKFQIENKKVTFKNYKDFDFKQKKITKELTYEYKKHILRQQDYFQKEAVIEKSIFLTLSILSIMIVLIYLIYKPIIYLIKQINFHCFVEDSIANIEELKKMNFVQKYFKSNIVFKALIFVYFTEYAIEFLYYLLYKHKNFNRLFFEANYFKFSLELLLVIHLYFFILYNTKEDISCKKNYIKKKSSMPIRTNEENNNDYMITSETINNDNDNIKYNNISRHWLRPIKYLLVILVLKSIVSFIFIHYKLLSQMKIKFIYYDIEKYIDIINYTLFIAYSLILIKFNINNNYFLFKFSNRNIIKLRHLFYLIQIFSFCIMFKYDYFSNTNASDENPIKAFYARIYYSILFSLIVFFVYNKQLYSEDQNEIIIPNFQNLKLLFFNFFFFVNDESERLVLLLFTLPCIFAFNYYITLAKFKQENEIFPMEVNKTDESQDISQESILKSSKNIKEYFDIYEIPLKEKEADVIKYSNIINNSFHSNNGFNEEDRHEAIKITEDNRNYYIYFIFCIIAINFIDNMTCVLMKQFSFDISLRAGSKTIGAKLEDFPIFTGIIFIFHKLQNYILISILLLDNIKISNIVFSKITYFSRTLILLIQIKLIGSMILNIIILWLGIDLTTTFVIYSGNYLLFTLFTHIPVCCYLIKLS